MQCRTAIQAFFGSRFLLQLYLVFVWQDFRRPNPEREIFFNKYAVTSSYREDTATVKVKERRQRAVYEIGTALTLSKS